MYRMNCVFKKIRIFTLHNILKDQPTEQKKTKTTLFYLNLDLCMQHSCKVDGVDANERKSVLCTVNNGVPLKTAFR